MLKNIVFCSLAFLGMVFWSGEVVCAQSRTAFEAARNQMVDEDVVGAGVKNDRVIAAMREVPRHEFVPLHLRKMAYFDMALPIGEGQTISPPFVVAYMTEALDPQPTDKVLEIGTGSGYQAAVLSRLVREVYTIEIVEPLGTRAAKTLQRLHYDNVKVKVGDGYLGWPEHAPFDKIIVTCSPEKVPAPLIAQLKEGGRMVIPVGERYQQTLYLLKKSGGKMISEKLIPTLFVPMTGAAEAEREKLPDAANPTIINGGFEEIFGDPPLPSGWHYLRQIKVVAASDAPEGEHYASFCNTTAGRGSHALQGFPVDGRKVSWLDVSVWVRGREIRAGQAPNQLPAVVISFYDEQRTTVGEIVLGPWRGTFDWQGVERRFPVPKKAREAVLRIGLLGAVGEACFDDVKVRAARQ